MALISNISTAWAFAEREMAQGLSAQQAFSRFLQDQQKAEWFRKRLFQLRHEYELIRSLVPTQTSETIVLLDFDVIRAYTTDESTKRADYLHIQHFFEYSKLRYAIPFGAIIELRKFFQSKLGLQEFPTQFNLEKTGERLQEYLVSQLNEPRSRLNDEKLEGVRIVANRLLRVLQDPRCIRYSYGYPSSEQIAITHERILAEIHRSPSHSHLQSDHKQEIAYNDALNLASLMGREASNMILLTTSRYVILASRGVLGLNPRVVKPRTLSLYSELTISESSNATLAKVTDIILALGSIDQRILKLDVDIALKAGVISERVKKRMDNDTNKIWYALREAIPDYQRIMTIEGKRSPLLSYEWVREELAMNSATAKMKGATVSYVRMLSVIQKCISEADTPNVREFVAVKGLPSLCNNIWVIREKGDLGSQDVQENPLGIGPAICKCSILERDKMGRSTMKIDWPLDTGYFPLIACIEDEYLSRMRRCNANTNLSEPFVSKEDHKAEYGVHVVLKKTTVVFPSAWIAKQYSMDFLYPWNLATNIIRSFDKAPLRNIRLSSVQSVVVTVPDEMLEYDISPSSGYCRRAAITFSNKDWSFRLGKIWPWMGPRSLENDAIIQTLKIALEENNPFRAGDQRSE